MGRYKDIQDLLNGFPEGFKELVKYDPMSHKVFMMLRQGVSKEHIIFELLKINISVRNEITEVLSKQHTSITIIKTNQK